MLCSDVDIVADTVLPVSAIVWTFAVLSVTDITCPTRPYSDITGILTLIPLLLPSLITIILS